MPTQTHTAPTTKHAIMTSTVLAVLLRVAGPVEIGMTTHALGTPQRQVSLRIGDVLVHLTDPRVAELVRQRWDAALGTALRLPPRVSQTWLAPRPGTYPTAISVQLTDHVRVAARFVAANPEQRQPGHLEIRVDHLVWQICDFTAWRAIGDAWFAAQQHLQD